MQASFNAQYAKLNPDQKRAVDFIDGPLLVIAGPGTGKTQLLSLRAANILKRTDSQPENILCLTFTESGAQQMQTRLIQMIGQDAYKINISTYHGFGSDIIRSNPEYFNGGINLRPLSDLRADVVIRDIQKGLSFKSDLKHPDAVSSIKNLISYAKKALLSPKDIESVANANLDFIESTSLITKSLTELKERTSKKSIPVFEKLYQNTTKDASLPDKIESLKSMWNSSLETAIEQANESNKATSLSKWKLKYLTRDSQDQPIPKGQLQNLKLIEFSKIYVSYNKRLSESNLYDYDDMILLSIEALKNNSQLRYSIQEQYLYLMLDEYQDTNHAQAELVQLLTNNPASEGRPNVMAVGDDDQAIFAFQGAKHSNMLDFVNSYVDTEIITLKNNYRSSQELINESSVVSAQISSRLTGNLGLKSKEFKSANNNKSEILNLNFKSELHQYIWLADQLKTVANMTVGVISPQHKYLERASAYLIDRGIKFTYERRENILEDVQIQQILSVLRLLRAINDKDHRQMNVQAAIVMNYEFWGLKTTDIWNISWQAADKNKNWLDIMLKNPSTKLFAEMLIKMASNSLAYRYDFIIDQVIGLSDIAINDTKTKSTRSPFFKYYLDNKNDLTASRLYQNLIVLRQQFKDFNSDNNQALMIGDLIDFVDNLLASGISLNNDITLGQTDSNIQLLTSHSAKGQEFDQVYILSLTNNAWGPKTRNLNQLSLPDNLKHISPSADDSEDERLRLLYVALTRAKTKLALLSFDMDANAKSTTPLKYLDNQPSNVEMKADIDLAPIWQKEDRHIEIDTDLKALLKKRLENYFLSPTNLNTFLDIRNAGPESFYRSVLLRYASPTSVRLDYGSAIHDSLDKLQKQFTSSSKLPTKQELISDFETALKRQKLVSHDYERFKEQGIQSLSAYYDDNKTSFSISDLSEYNFKGQGLAQNGVRLTGKIDKLIVDNNSKTLKIIDYKTGRGVSRWSNEPKLHLYKYQLYFYKLLVDKSRSFQKYKVEGGRLDFIDPDPVTGVLHNIDLPYNEDEQKHFISLVAAVWKHINDLNFPDTSNYGHYYSDMVKFEDDLINGRI